jgi:hypothetical protein
MKCVREREATGRIGMGSASSFVLRCEGEREREQERSYGKN